MEDKTLIIMVGYACNNNCIICSNRPDGLSSKNRTTEEIKSDILKGKKEGYRKVEFTGGEPTVRPDFLALAEYARDLKLSEIAVSTNGRLFSYDKFRDKAITAGINRVTFTVYGPSNFVHDAITRTPGSFNQTIKGIQNVLERPEVIVTTSTVVTAMNYLHLSETKKMLSDMGVKRWSIAELIPYGNAQKFYKTLAVKLTDLSYALNDVIASKDDLYFILLFDFPLCLFSPEVRSNETAQFITAKGRAGMNKQTGYDHIGERVSVGEESQAQDCHKERTESCKKCVFGRDCAGIWKEYIGLYGDKEIKKLAFKNDCF